MQARFAEFVVDTDTREVLRRGEPLHLSPKAFELLVKLIESSPRALEKSRILELVWPATYVSEGTVAAVVSELRSALDDDPQQPRYIRTVYGFGYAFCGELAGLATAASELNCRLIWGSREISLLPGENILGREKRSVAWIDDPSISRHHARISVFPTHAILEDLGSKNGTFLAGRRIDGQQPLSDGDRITFGRVPMVFRIFADGGPTESVHSR